MCHALFPVCHTSCMRCARAVLTLWLGSQCATRPKCIAPACVCTTRFQTTLICLEKIGERVLGKFRVFSLGDKDGMEVTMMRSDGTRGEETKP